MNAVKIGNNFLVEPGQFPIQAYGAVSFSLGAFVLVGTVGAVFALVELLCPAIAIPLHRDVPQEEELFVIWADKTSVLSHTKINRPKGIFPIFFVSVFLLVHWKLHVFFYFMFFTKEIIVITAIPCIAYRILRIMSVMLAKPFHEGWKAVHISGILLDIIHSNIFVANPQLQIVRRKKLVVAHIVPLYTHECCVLICFGVAVSLFPTNLYMLGVFF